MFLGSLAQQYMGGGFELASPKQRSASAMIAYRISSLNFILLALLDYVNINRKPYMGSPMTLSHLALRDLERSISRSHRFQRLISRKAAELYN